VNSAPLQAETNRSCLGALEELHPEIGKALRIEVDKVPPEGKPRVATPEQKAIIEARPGL